MLTLLEDTLTHTHTDTEQLLHYNPCIIKVLKFILAKFSVLVTSPHALFCFLLLSTETVLKEQNKEKLNHKVSAAHHCQ